MDSIFISLELDISKTSCIDEASAEKLAADIAHKIELTVSQMIKAEQIDAVPVNTSVYSSDDFVSLED